MVGDLVKFGEEGVWRGCWLDGVDGDVFDGLIVGSADSFDGDYLPWCCCVINGPKAWFDGGEFCTDTERGGLELSIRLADHWCDCESPILFFGYDRIYILY